MPKAAARRPSVIVIMADEMGYGDLGCYGQTMIHTPRIDELATGGMRFTTFYAGGATDAAARAALLVGRATGETLPSDVPTLAEALQKAGYRTGLIGEWGLGAFDSPDAPQQRGFDVVVTYGDRRHAQDLYAGHLYRKDPYSGFEGAVQLAGNPAGKLGDFLPDLLTEAATRFCKQNKPERFNNYRPFFLLLSYPVPAAVAMRSGPVPASEAYADMDWPALQKDRANAITRLDKHVGALMDELDERGMAQNTIVMLTSSLGPEVQKSLVPEFFKSTGAYSASRPLGEGRLRVPLIVRWPFWIKAGGVSGLLLSGQDILPTVVDAAGMDGAPESEGISFLPLLQGLEQTNHHEYLSWETFDSDRGTGEAVRFEDWKGLRTGVDQPWQLYDLTTDPAEQTDLAEKHPDVVRKLATLPQSRGTIGSRQAPKE